MSSIWLLVSKCVLSLCLFRSFFHLKLNLFGTVGYSLISIVVKTLENFSSTFDQHLEESTKELINLANENSLNFEGRSMMDNSKLDQCELLLLSVDFDDKDN